MELFLRNYPKQVALLTKAKSVPTNIREFLSGAQRHYRTDVTASTVERKTGGLASAGGCKDKGSNAHFIRLTCKICGTVRKEERHPQRFDTRTTGGATHPRERRIVLIVELTLILFRMRSSTLSRQHVQLLRIVTRSWQIGSRETRRSRSNTLILRQE